MLASFTISPFNYVLRQESWACNRLQPYAGKIVRIRILPSIDLGLTILENGELDYVRNPIDIDCTLVILPTLLPGLLASDALAYDSIQRSGDTALAETLIQISKNLKLDFAPILSKWIGDIPAHRLAQAGNSIFQWHINTAKNLSDAFGEYWLEEQPTITKSNVLKIAAQQIQTLQHDVEQLENRIDRIIQTQTDAT